MERAEFLKKMRSNAEALYDRFSPRYWVSWGLEIEETHREFMQKFLDRMPPGGMILSAACGAGRFDGLLLEAGHRVVGIDQSAGMLKLAKEHFPQVQYQKMALHEMKFHETFNGVICMDAMEHICPEDYLGILRGFQEALQPGGVLYFTADREEEPDFDLQEYYEKGKAAGLPIVFGEVADVEAFGQAMEQTDAPDELADRGVYHYYPPLEKVRQWIEGAGLGVEQEGAGAGFHHFVVSKKKA
jgi:SAM-dependent methyltransferase